MPREIDRSAGTEVRIRWPDDHESVFPARTLRLACPCAECVDEATGVRVLEPERVPEGVRVMSASLVGRYAVAFRFDDGHALGFYTFDGLRRACPCAACGEGGRP